MTRNIEKIHVFIAISFFFVLFMSSRRRENFTTCGMAPINTDTPAAPASAATSVTTALMVDEQGNTISQVPIQAAPPQKAAGQVGTGLMTETTQSSAIVDAGPGALIEISNAGAPPAQNPNADSASMFSFSMGTNDIKAGGPTLDNGQLVVPQSLAQNAALQSEDPATKTQNASNWMGEGIPMF